ncbi:hypothetical protein HDU97_001997 [Phlyctochytrium planicorne]|nr:hypothetical protein HDU97_001997 [Phlyctochytrium planicorne]
MEETRTISSSSSNLQRMGSLSTSAIIDPSLVSVDVQKCLGSGASGIVFAARYANEVVVVKRLKVQALSKANEEDFKREAATLASLNHPKIVRFLGVVIEQERYSIVMEYLPLGSLFSFYSQNPVIPISERISLALDLATGMKYLHDCDPPVLHRDLKSLNVLMYKDQSGILHGKITDFGIAIMQTATMLNSAKATGNGSSQAKGTLLWMAPELHQLRVVYRMSSDVYSYGVVLTEIASWLGPYTTPINNLAFDAVHNMLTVERRLPQLTFPPDTPVRFSHMIQQCLSLQPTLRPKFTEIVTELNAIFGYYVSGAAAGDGTNDRFVDSVVFEVSATDVSSKSKDSDMKNSSISSPPASHAPFAPMPQYNYQYQNQNQYQNMATQPAYPPAPLPTKAYPSAQLPTKDLAYPPTAPTIATQQPQQPQQPFVKSPPPNRKKLYIIVGAILLVMIIIIVVVAVVVAKKQEDKGDSRVFQLRAANGQCLAATAIRACGSTDKYLNMTIASSGGLNVQNDGKCLGFSFGGGFPSLPTGAGAIADSNVFGQFPNLGSAFSLDLVGCNDANILKFDGSQIKALDTGNPLLSFCLTNSPALS